jgi:hypothetical protein
MRRVEGDDAAREFQRAQQLGHGDDFASVLRRCPAGRG